MSIYIFMALIDDLKACKMIDSNSLAIEYKYLIRLYKLKYNNR